MRIKAKDSVLKGLTSKTAKANKQIEQGIEAAKIVKTEQEALKLAKHTAKDARLFAASHKAPKDQKATVIMARAAKHAANVQVCAV